jgi:hypothetical protein
VRPDLEGSLDAGHSQTIAEVLSALVEWFNAVAATYRSDVRAIADAQSARIDAQMGQMRAELRAGFARVDERLDGRMEGLNAELLRWMFLFWVGSMGTVLAILKL